MFACQSGKTEIVELLLGNRDINPNLCDLDGESALVLAARNGHVEVVGKLIRHLAIDINEQHKKSGYTPLMVAVRNGHLGVAWRLLRHPDIDITLKDFSGDTILDIVQQEGNQAITNLFEQFLKIKKKKHHCVVQ